MKNIMKMILAFVLLLRLDENSQKFSTADHGLKRGLVKKCLAPVGR